MALAVAAPQASAAPPPGGNAACYVTGGGALEICRSADEAEGVYVVPPPCRFVHDVQILRLKETGPPGPINHLKRAGRPGL
ncbi:hypothetical protein MZTS_10730, partial [Methylorubrum zatmanii]|nr:hypothetical protein [Methylorubrum zatmanii]